MRQTSKNFKVDFLIMTALPEERDAVLRLLHRPEVITVEENLICQLCYLDPHPLEAEKSVAITTLSQMGNVESGIHATTIIHALKPRFVLMLGIAAGIKKKVRLGDVLVAQQIIYYELGKLTANEHQFRPESAPVDPHLYQCALSYSDVDWRTLVLKARPRSKSRGLEQLNPSVHFGPLAVGDKVVADESHLRTLLGIHPKIIGIEMESYGTARATWFYTNRPGFLAIRGVSDYADSNKDDRWREYACSTSAAYAIGLIRFARKLEAATLPLEKNLTSNAVVVSHLSLQPIFSTTVVDVLEADSIAIVGEVAINQSDLFDNGRLTDPWEAAKRQIGVSQKINELLSVNTSAYIRYFGVAHIPLLFQLGFQLTNKRKLSFYEYDRLEGIWRPLGENPTWPKMLARGIPKHHKTKAGEVVVRISVSNTVETVDVKQIVANPISAVHLYLDPPTRDVLVNEKQLWEYGAVFRKTLDLIHERLPNRRATHIFYAGPVSLAVYFGQLISHTFDGKIFVYNYTVKDEPKYSWGFEITEPIDSQTFYITNSA